MKSIIIPSLLVSSLMLIPMANAATITFGSAVDFGDNVDTSVLISGTSTTITDHDRFGNVNGAFAGSTSGTDITGVSFNDGVSNGGTADGAISGTPGSDTFTSANLAAALTSFDSGTNNNNTGPYQNGALTFTGLIEGTTYAVQLFYSDQRPQFTERVITYDDGLGNSVSLASSGQYAIGTFVADSTGTQSIFANGLDGTDPIGGDLSLSVLAVSPIPEPSSAALLLGAFGIMAFRRRRN